ncbi:hypothetical protein M153_156700021, partial [Pseudoloma neurophilia]
RLTAPSMSEIEDHVFLLTETQLEDCLKFPENQNVTGSNNKDILLADCNLKCKTVDQIFNVECKCQKYNSNGLFISSNERTKTRQDTSEIEERAKDANTSKILKNCISGENNDLNSLTTWSKFKGGDKILKNYSFHQNTKYNATNLKKLITINPNYENSEDYISENEFIGSGDLPYLLPTELNAEHNQNNEHTSEKIELFISHSLYTFGAGMLAISLFAFGIMIYKKIIKKKDENDEENLLY